MVISSRLASLINFLSAWYSDLTLLVGSFSILLMQPGDSQNNNIVLSIYNEQWTVSDCITIL